MPIQSPFEHSWAVVIGINAYTDPIPTLRSARPDAERVAALLREKHGYTVDLLVDGQATRAALTTLLTEDLPKRVGPNDQLLFYFAGHGVTQKEDAGPQGMLLPVDAVRHDASTYLEMKELYEALEGLPCPHLFVVLDACFSGTFRWYSTRADFDRDPASDEGLHRETYEYFLRSPARQVLTSTAQDEQALDVLEAPGVFGARGERGDHSPFAQAFCAGLEGLADTSPAPSGDGLITARELHSAISDGMAHAFTAANSDYRQTPSLWAMRSHGKGEYLFFNPKKDALTLRPAPPLDLTTNPWVGLASYEAAQQELFFGRAAQIEALAAKVADEPIVVVRGASGTGKSSLVKAGLLPTLPASEWFVLPVMRPGVVPLQSLAQAVGVETSASVPDTRDIAARVDALLAEQAPRKVMLVIDQFEEMTTQARSTEERDAALALLQALADKHPAQLRLVFTIRSDFSPLYDRLPIGQAWKPGIYDIPRMTRAQFRDVIEKPAEKRVMIFEPPTLVDTLVDAVVDMPGALPLLSFVLSELYVQYLRRRADDRAITGKDYDDLGGVAGALQQRADELMDDALPDDAHRETLRRVMLRMVTQEGGTLARRRVLRDEELDYPDATEQGRVATVLQRLSEARLVVSGTDADGQSFVEPAHDALVTGWGRLRDWITEERLRPFSLGLQQRLARAAEEWSRGTEKGKDGQLWADATRSALLAPLVKEQAPFLNRREREFARLSVRGRRTRQGLQAAGLTVLALATAAAFVFGIRAQASALRAAQSSRRADSAATIARTRELEARESARRADSSALEATRNATLALLRGEEAKQSAAVAQERSERLRVTAIVGAASTFVDRNPTLAGLLLGTLDSALLERADDAARLAILEVSMRLQRRPRVVTTFAQTADSTEQYILNKDASAVATIPRPGKPIRIWRTDRAGPAVQLSNVMARIRTAALSPTGTYFAASDNSRDLRVWRVSEPSKPIVQLKTQSWDNRLQFSPDDSAFLVSGFSGWHAWFGLSGEKKRHDFQIGPGSRVWFGASSRELIVFDSVAQSLSLATLPPRKDVSLVLNGALGQMQPSDAVSLNPFGTRLAVSRKRGEVDLVEFPSGRPLWHFTHESMLPVSHLLWSRDGTRLLVALNFGSNLFCYVLDARTGLVIGSVFTPFGGIAERAAIGVDGRRILTSGTAFFQYYLWDIRDSSWISLDGLSEFTELGTLLRDDQHAITATRSGYGQLWELPALPRLTLTAYERPMRNGFKDTPRVMGMVFDSRSENLAIASSQGEVIVAGVDHDSPVRRVLTGTRAIRWVAFAGNSGTVDMLDEDGRMLRMSVASGATRATRPVGPVDESAPESPSRSDNGRQFVELDGDSIRLIDLAGQTVRVFYDSLVNPTCAAIDSRAQRIAICSDDHTVILTTDGKRLLQRVGHAKVPAVAAAFSSRGMGFALGFRDGSVRVFSGVVGNSGRLLPGRVRRPDRLEFSPDGSRLLSFSRDVGVVTVWSLGKDSSTVTLRREASRISEASFIQGGQKVLATFLRDSVAYVWNASGAGSPFVVTTEKGTLLEVVASPDGKWLAMTGAQKLRSGDGWVDHVELLPIDLDNALSPYRRTPLCLSAEERVRYAAEEVSVAQRKFLACEANRLSVGGHWEAYHRRR